MKKVKENLEHIIEICEDGSKGYETAANNVDNIELKTIFNRLSQQRKLFVEELKNEARIQGMDLSDSGSVKGFFHRTWLSTKATFSFNNEESIGLNISSNGRVVFWKKAFKVVRRPVLGFSPLIFCLKIHRFL